MKAIQAMKRPMTPELAVEIHRALLDMDKPFAKELAKLYSIFVPPIIVNADMTIERQDPYLSLPPELKELADKVLEMRRECHESVLRAYGIDPAEIGQQKASQQEIYANQDAAKPPKQPQG
jgi:hypothetical protein